MKKAFGVATVLVLSLIGLSPTSGHAAGKGGPHGKAASSEGKFEAAESAQEAFEARNAPGFIQPRRVQRSIRVAVRVAGHRGRRGTR